MEDNLLAKRMARAQAKVEALEKLIEDKSRELFIANQKVQKAYDNLGNAINSMLSSLVVADAQGVIQSANDATLHMLGYETGELQGQPLTVLGSGDGDLDLSSVAALTKHEPRHETKFRTKTGGTIPVLLSSSGLYAAGQLAGVVCVALDLSNYKKLEAQLLQSEKMASIGQLAAGVAHEINNPMGFIFSNLGTLSEYFGDLTHLLQSYDGLEKAVEKGDLSAAQQSLQTIVAQKQDVDLAYLLEDIADLIQESSDGAERVRQIVLNLKEFSHVGRENKMPADINAGIESTLNIIWNELKYKVTLDKQYGDLPHVSCFIQELNQVFMNLLVNAGQSIADHGQITIRTYETEDSICVDIADTGKGMSPEVQRRILEPFYTTKKVGEGTGLGLSMAYQIVVDKHGGQLQFDSKEGEGTTFTVKIPKD
jgi:PAS domain S-box-containing protein